MTWDTIFPDLAATPLRGRPADFETASGETRRVHTASITVQTQFARIRDGQIDELRGGAATGLADVVDGVDRRLADLPPVFGGLHEVFADHAERLRELDGEVSRALARARTHWAAHRDAVQRHATERGALAAIEAQLESVRRSAATSVDGADVEALIDELEAGWRRQRDTVGIWRDRVDTAIDELAASRREYLRFADREAELIGTTAAALRAIDLAALADPSGLSALIDATLGALFSVGVMVLDALTDVAIEQLAALAGAILTVAEAVFVESLRLLALALKGVLHTLATLVVLVLVQVALVAGLFALAVFAALPPHLKARVISAVAGFVSDLLRVPRDGDPGGTYEATVEGVWADGSAPGLAEDGRAALVGALDLTANGAVVDPDEFALVQLENGKYIIVLPGVTDLSNPRLGLNPHNRTVRDVDQHALPSSTSIGMDDNLYAQMVAEAMRRHGVPPGSEVMIVGHSFGADTALDLAADPRFNGPGAYTVTHVAAAAYHSGPQLRHVPAGTEVLVLQNNQDVPVQVENFGYHPVGLVDSFDDALDRFIARDPAGGFAELTDTGRHASGLVVDGVAVRSGVSPIADTQRPGVHQPRPDQVVSVFAGGSTGAGHAQSNYTDYLTTHTSRPVAGFEHSVGASGYGAPGQIVTIDVSIPAR